LTRSKAKADSERSGPPLSILGQPSPPISETGSSQNEGLYHLVTGT